METPLAKIKKILKEKAADGILVTNPTNIFYLTSFRGLSPEDREVCLLVRNDSMLLFLPKMYEAQGQTLGCIRKKQTELKVCKERGRLLEDWKQHTKSTKPILYEADDLRVSDLTNLQKNTTTELRASTAIIRKLRSIKTENEIEKLNRAVTLTDEVLLKCISFLKHSDYPKLTELDIVDKLQTIARNSNNDGFSFDPIVASGQNSAEPHYTAKNKKLRKGELLLIDVGIRYQGYCGDLTRCVHLGKAPDAVKKIHHIVRENEEKSIEMCRPGITASELYKISNNHFKKLRLEKFFLRRLGHSIGLEVHEEPSLYTGDQTILKESMTFTVEPGLYFNKKFGIRIEDFVVITKNGCKTLSKSPKQLIEI